MMLRAPPPNFPQALENDADDVVWALRTAGVQWSVGAATEAIEWLMRAVEMSIDAGRIDRARDIQRNVNELNNALRSGSVPPPGANGDAAAPPQRRPSSLPPLPPPPGFEAFEAEMLDEDVDVELEDEIETLEVLEPEVIDSGDEYDDGTDRLEVEPIERLTAASDESDNDDDSTQLDDDDDDASTQLDDDDIKPLTDGAVEVDEALLQSEEPPQYARSEPPTSRVMSSEPATASVPAIEPSDEPDDPTLPTPEVSSRPPGSHRGPPPLPPVAPAAAKAPELEPIPTTAPVESVSFPGTPGSAPEKREPWQTSPSFGDNLGPFSDSLAPPPASVVFLAAGAVPAIEDVLDEVAPELPPRVREELEAESSPVAPASVAPASVPPSILGIQLSEVHGLEDLPEDAQRDLVRSVEIHLLEAEEEVSGFGLALVLEGRVSVMPAVMDVVCVQAGRGDLIFAEGHVEEGVSLKVVAADDGTRVASWPIEQFARAIAPCPWVRDDLRRVGDHLQAMVGAAMGRLGEQLDEQLRSMVLDRCTIKLLLPGELAAEAGKPLTGMTIVGAGRLELVDASGNPLPGDRELGAGDFVFPSEMLRAATAPATARAARSGALIVFADRKTAHELLMSVPPLIEVLSS
jgi:hypothetical protein